ncbi:SurA N-terminal domain-containing protein, partial [Georgenia sp. 10Sc9-8]|nr:SurA N-terminal domain-containing protein [Georgenia halotolerans]
AEQDGAEQPEQPEQPEMPEPDLEDVPDPVAEVNGEEIPREEFVRAYEGQFQQLAAQAQISGEEPDQAALKDRVAEGLVDTELLIQEAEERGFEASQEEIDALLEEIATSNGLESGEEFISTMGEQGMEEDEVISQLETQIKVEELIDDEAGDTTPAEEDVQELYDQAVEQQEQAGDEAGELPPLEEVRPQLEQQLQSQEENEAIMALLEDLRENADITVHLE